MFFHINDLLQCIALLHISLYSIAFISFWGAQLYTASNILTVHIFSSKSLAILSINVVHLPICKYHDPPMYHSFIECKQYQSRMAIILGKCISNARLLQSRHDVCVLFWLGCRSFAILLEKAVFLCMLTIF